MVREKTAGESFGDKVILRENSKMAVVKSKGKAEFLRVDKEDIEKVLKLLSSFFLTSNTTLIAHIGNLVFS